MGYREEFVVKPGAKLHLDRIDPAYKGKHESHEKAAPEIAASLERVDRFQYLLYADASQSLLVVLQALDAAGKDGVIRHLFTGMNPQGIRVVGFKQPSADECAHDFLWRVHQHAPARGEVVIYNRSHYEDVLVVRVHELVPHETWSRRYELINDFERILAANGTRVLKFYLHISPVSSSIASSSGSTIPSASGKSAKATMGSADCGADISKPTRKRLSGRVPAQPRGS